MSLPRTFARVRAFDAVCPSCGAVAALVPWGQDRSTITDKKRYRKGKGQSKTRREWDVNLGVWRCRSCAAAMSVGIVIWKMSPSTRYLPGDRVPTPAESLGLRGLVTGARVGTGPHARGNLVSEGGVETDPALPKRETITREPWAGLEEDD